MFFFSFLFLTDYGFNCRYWSFGLLTSRKRCQVCSSFFYKQFLLFCSITETSANWPCYASRLKRVTWYVSRQPVRMAFSALRSLDTIAYVTNQHSRPSRHAGHQMWTRVKQHSATKEKSCMRPESAAVNLCTPCVSSTEIKGGSQPFRPFSFWQTWAFNVAFGKCFVSRNFCGKLCHSSYTFGFPFYLLK